MFFSPFFIEVVMNKQTRKASLSSFALLVKVYHSRALRKHKPCHDKPWLCLFAHKKEPAIMRTPTIMSIIKSTYCSSCYSCSGWHLPLNLKGLPWLHRSSVPPPLWISRKILSSFVTTIHYLLFLVNPFSSKTSSFHPFNSAHPNRAELSFE